MDKTSFQNTLHIDKQAMPRTFTGNKFPSTKKINVHEVIIHKEEKNSAETALKIGDHIQLTNAKIREFEKTLPAMPNIQGEVTSFHGKMIMVALGNIETLVMHDDIKKLSD